MSVTPHGVLPIIEEVLLTVDGGASVWVDAQDLAISPILAHRELVVGVPAPEVARRLCVHVGRPSLGMYATHERLVRREEEDVVYLTVPVPRSAVDRDDEAVVCTIGAVYFELPDHPKGSELIDTVGKLRREITTMRESAEKRNRQLDLLGIVWCDGGCPGGMHRYTDQEVTAEDIAFLIHNAFRARTWFIGRATGKGHDDYIARGGEAAMGIVERLGVRHEQEITTLKEQLRTATQTLAQVLEDCQNNPTVPASDLALIQLRVRFALDALPKVP